MTKLTTAQVKKELADIAAWPIEADYVFMKNLYDGRLGFLLFKADRGKSPIQLHAYDEDTAARHPGRVMAVSLEALVEAGWVVD